MAPGATTILDRLRRYARRAGVLPSAPPVSALTAFRTTRCGDPEEFSRFWAATKAARAEQAACDTDSG